MICAKALIDILIGLIVHLTAFGHQHAAGGNQAYGSRSNPSFTS